MKCFCCPGGGHGHTCCFFSPEPAPLLNHCLPPPTWLFPDFLAAPWSPPEGEDTAPPTVHGRGAKRKGGSTKEKKGGGEGRSKGEVTLRRAMAPSRRRRDARHLPPLVLTKNVPSGRLRLEAFLPCHLIPFFLRLSRLSCPSPPPVYCASWSSLSSPQPTSIVAALGWVVGIAGERARLLPFFRSPTRATRAAPRLIQVRPFFPYMSLLPLPFFLLLSSRHLFGCFVERGEPLGLQADVFWGRGLSTTPVLDQDLRRNAGGGGLATAFRHEGRAHPLPAPAKTEAFGPLVVWPRCLSLVQSQASPLSTWGVWGLAPPPHGNESTTIYRMNRTRTRPSQSPSRAMGRQQQQAAT